MLIALTKSGVEVQRYDRMGPHLTSLLQVHVERMGQYFHAAVNFQLRSGLQASGQKSGERHGLKENGKTLCFLVDVVSIKAVH